LKREQILVQRANVLMRGFERAFDRPDAVLQSANLGFDVDAHIGFLAQFEASASAGNEPQHFSAAYRKAGGDIALDYIDADRHTGRSPDLSQTGDMFARMVEFVGRHVG
jgi:acetyl esterase